MKREEAIQVLRTILDECDLTDGYSFSLIPPKPDNPLSVGYKLQLRIPISQAEKSCISEIVTKKGLAMNSIEDLTIIYKPQPEKMKH